MDGALADVEVVGADGLRGVPLALPVELAGDLPPEPRWILDGLLVHLLILYVDSVSVNSQHSKNRVQNFNKGISLQKFKFVTNSSSNVLTTNSPHETKSKNILSRKPRIAEIPHNR